MVVEGHGPVPCSFMIVGEAPGRKEIHVGTPFCGASGRLLDQALEAGGASRYGVYVTNAYKGDVGSGNRNPTQDELDDHWPLLEAELNTVQPRGVLLLGRVANKAFGIHDPMAAIVGGRMDDLLAGRSYFPCWHPAYVLYGGTTREEFFRIVGGFLAYRG